MQMGRGRQSWGAGNDIQLALSDSPSYDYGLLGLHLKILGLDTSIFHRY